MAWYLPAEKERKKEGKKECSNCMKKQRSSTVKWRCNERRRTYAKREGVDKTKEEVLRSLWCSSSAGKNQTMQSSKKGMINVHREGCGFKSPIIIWWSLLLKNLQDNQMYNMCCHCLSTAISVLPWPDRGACQVSHCHRFSKWAVIIQTKSRRTRRQQHGVAMRKISLFIHR